MVVTPFSTYTGGVQNTLYYTWHDELHSWSQLCFHQWTTIKLGMGGQAEQSTKCPRVI